MTTLKQLRGYCRDKMSQHPEKKGEIMDFYTMAVESIEDGGSEANEVMLAWQSIEEIFDED